jgi:hypothetical protein
VGAGAPFAVELVSGEPRRALVILGDLDELAAREAPAAADTRRGLGPGDGCGRDVFTRRAAVLEIGALAHLTTAADDYLLDGCCIVLGGDVPDAALEADLFGVLAVELLAAQDAGDDGGDVLEVSLVGGAWVRGLR